MKLIATILSLLICSVTYGQKGIGLKFEYNKTAQTKVVPLTGMYMTMKGQYLSTSVSIPPYSSVILIKLDSPPLALCLKDFALQTNANTTTVRAVICDDVTGLQKTVTFKYKFR